MKICCVTSNPQVEYIKTDLENLGELEIHNKQKLTADELVQIAKNVEVLIIGPAQINPLDKSLIDKLAKLKFLALLTVGSSWVDVEYAHTKGIVVSNIKGANSESVAEHTWGMILDLAKRINEFDRDARLKGAFKFSGYKGKEVFGKTLGIIGLGDIGKKVARIACGFNMNIIGVNKSNSVVEGIKLVSLNKLLSKSDVIVISVPLTEETKGLISETEINKMKNGVIVVNCAREKVVEKDSILNGIASGKIFGYGVETAIMTQVHKDDPYYKCPNIIITPHNAFNTEDADKKSYELVVGNIKAWVNGHPQNVI